VDIFDLKAHFGAASSGFRSIPVRTGS